MARAARGAESGVAAARPGRGVLMESWLMVLASGRAVPIAHGSGAQTNAPVGGATVRTTVWQVGHRAESLATFFMPGRRNGGDPVGFSCGVKGERGV